MADDNALREIAAKFRNPEFLETGPIRDLVFDALRQVRDQVTAEYAKRIAELENERDVAQTLADVREIEAERVRDFSDETYARHRRAIEAGDKVLLKNMNRRGRAEG